MFEIEALYLEDIILDMRDRICSVLGKVKDSDIKLSDGFISEVEGKMEFYVRQVLKKDSAPQRRASDVDQMHIQQSVVGNTNDLQWKWKTVNDFDRMEKFSDDEVFQDEVVFKLIKSNNQDEEVLDEKPDHILQGYDCFSIYKHQDNSYEWRLCKIIGKDLRPEFKVAGQFLDALKKEGETQELG